MQNHPEFQAPPQIHRAIPPDQGSLAALLQFEGELRRWPTVPELVYHIANETRRIIAYDQMFVLRHARIGEGFQVIAASSLATIDRNAPLIQAVEKTIAALAADATIDQPRAFASNILHQDAALADYPFGAWYWQPLHDANGAAFAGLIVARATPMREGEAIRLDRLGETAGHAWRALAGGVPVRRVRKFGPRERKGLVVLLTGIALFPVQMTALAPVEVVSARPFVVAAPFSGVIKSIDVAPNAAVKAGQPVLTLDDTKVRNELEQAAEKLQVARARVERSTSAAFEPDDETRDITIMRAEYDVAEADYAYARDMLSRSHIVAPRAGVALYSDRRDWEGRAVNVGDPILQIVNPEDIELRIDLPTKEQMELAPGNQVKAWLDAQPLWSIDARLENVSYQSRQTASGVLAFTVTAKPIGAKPRIGSRGTAKVYGRWAPLSYVLLRRPISSLRQYLGL
ncbi:Biotin-lipoyl like [Sphingopyxis sp. YR583]|uniref:efflux RND transporter periplasmic adaptor subunit n=1 Tax=Sphingopyxis sp. YR583 TaxID=1881047 RepID=UPI0008A73C44|nr:HlyD family efflux transporter periplasmic adaptor subunit [Sphingopyxis sp. YR583]SEH17176.1 Biotin-lipoyl like [Sphingopyxis sp. YR583]